MEEISLPKQTPLYRVAQQDRYLRQELIKKIEGYTERRLLIYVSNVNHPQSAITRDDVVAFNDLLVPITGKEPIDLVLESGGGDPNAAEVLASSLLAKADHLRIFIPQAAKSAATLLSLAADEIVMSDTSELGPIDPQVPLPTAQGIIFRSAAAILETIAAVREEHREKVSLNPAYFPILQGVDAALLASCEKAKEHSHDLAIQHVKRSLCQDHDVAEGVVNALLDGYQDHGAPISHAEAKRIGLPVTYQSVNDALWQSIWRLYVHYFHFLRETQAVKVFESSEASIVL